MERIKDGARLYAVIEPQTKMQLVSYCKSHGIQPNVFLNALIKISLRMNEIPKDLLNSEKIIMEQEQADEENKLAIQSNEG